MCMAPSEGAFHILAIVNFQVTLFLSDLYKRKWLHRTIVPIATKTKIKCRKSGRKKERSKYHRLLSTLNHPGPHEILSKLRNRLMRIIEAAE